MSLPLLLPRGFAGPFFVMGFLELDPLLLAIPNVSEESHGKGVS